MKSNVGRVTSGLQDIVLDSLNCMASCRDVPESVIKVAREQFLMNEEELSDIRWRGGYREVESAFGINANAHKYFPASAFQGPFLQLLRHSNGVGLDFVIEFLNTSSDWYGKCVLPTEYVELPEEISITFSDGVTKQQWCNDRLWKMYRGTSVGPTVLQSALMALEYWLFETAEACPALLDQILQRILRQSNNAALTAVVASLAIAHPNIAVESLLILLSSPDCIIFDKQRMVADYNPPSSWFGGVSGLNAKNEIYNNERKKADARPHRMKDLEIAILTIQMGHSVERVQQILDQHRKAISSCDEQDGLDHIWRISLHRMDLRRYQPTVETVEIANLEQEGVSTQQMDRIRFELVAAESDLEAIISESVAHHADTNLHLSLQMWGIKVFERADAQQYDPSKWKVQLSSAQSVTNNSTPAQQQGLGESGPAFVAAVCARDHWEEMTETDQVWCADAVCSEIEQSSDEWHQMARIQRFSMAGDRPTAWAVSALAGRATNPDLQVRVLKALVLAITHSNDEVRNYAAAGVGQNLWKTDRELARRCVNLLASEAIMIEEELKKQENLPYQSQRSVYDIEPQIAQSVRESFFKADGIPADAYCKCDPATRTGSEAFSRMLAILLHAPAENMAVEAFRKMSETLVTWWQAKDDRQQNHGRQRERPYEIEPALSDVLERFLFRVTQETATMIFEPILNAVENHPREVSIVILGILGIEDQVRQPAHFWFLWGIFAEKITTADWILNIDQDYSKGSEMMSMIFLNTRWKSNVRHWSSLEGYADRVHTLFERLPASPRIFEDYVSFLYHIGEQSLPNAFIHLAHKLNLPNSAKLLNGRNTVYLLEVLLQRHVYVRPRELKQRIEMRDSILHVLDLLVEIGSSAAFKMRDDFVTPLSADQS